MKVSKENISPYTWGDNCLGWRLVSDNNLSVIEEEMPSGSSEKNHYHKNAQQLFFILKGVASFEFKDRTEIISTGEACYIRPNKIHYIKKDTKDTLRFLVISQPSTLNDRWEV